METVNKTRAVDPGRASSSWDDLTRDMKVAVDRVYSPLEVECITDEESRIDYFPPFYMDGMCDEACVGVTIKCGQGEVPQYPLICRSKLSEEQFVVQSPKDWENHAEKFIAWKTDIEALIRRLIHHRSHTTNLYTTCMSLRDLIMKHLLDWCEYYSLMLFVLLIIIR